MEKKVYSVSDITLSIKRLLEESLPTLWIEGEVSNFKTHYSGHLYFSLKDENAQISAVMWKSRADSLDFELRDGLLVQVLGNVRLYEKSGRYQVDVLQMKPSGAGLLQKAFEELKMRLFSEGLFAEENKKPIPAFPEKIAIITSPTGAAIRDILNILRRRAPYLDIYVRPCQVQGKGAEKEIAKAIAEINSMDNIDVIITGRGGGSLEDLWAFNEEVVARAIYNSRIPVVSAVGHEIDFTISDFVADLRAPTPSAAAEMIVSDHRDIINTFSGIHSRLVISSKNNLDFLRQKIVALQKSHGLKRTTDIIHQYAQRIDELNIRSVNNIKNYLKIKNLIISSLCNSVPNLALSSRTARMNCFLPSLVSRSMPFCIISTFRSSSALIYSSSGAR